MVVILINEGVYLFRAFAPDAQRVEVMGTFTGWRDGMIPLSRTRDGWWEAIIELPAGDHAFGYLLDGDCWRPDYAAGGLHKSPLGGWESLLAVPQSPRDGGARPLRGLAPALRANAERAVRAA